MRPAELGFLLLTAHLGNPDRRVLTTVQLRTLGQQVRKSNFAGVDCELTQEDLQHLGYSADMAHRIMELLSEEELLRQYLILARRANCVPVTRISADYPVILTKILGLEATGCLWLKGDSSLLSKPCIALVGSREIRRENAFFAERVGIEAARQGYALVSGNARGADRIAQKACLDHGGSVICVVADSLADKHLQERVLYISEDGFDMEFSAQRAISRNRLIHTLGRKTFVAQSDFERGGTWDGTTKNLRNCWSDVYCFNDGSAATVELGHMGAELIQVADLMDIAALGSQASNFLNE